MKRIEKAEEGSLEALNLVKESMLICYNIINDFNQSDLALLVLSAARLNG